MRAVLVSLVLAAACSAQPSPSDPRLAETSSRLEVSEREIADLRDRLEATEADLAWYVDQLASAQQDAKDARDTANQVQCCGTFPMWNLPTVQRPGRYGIAGVPDTFTFHLRFTSESPVRARIMTYEQLHDLLNGRTVETPYSWGPTTSLDVDFREAEGCAFYVLVLDAATETVFRPDIWITRAHNAPPSGACR